MKTDLSRRITVTNPDTDPTKAKKRINLEAVFPKFAATDLDPSTVNGITNIQRVLVKLGFLAPDSVTGTYGPVTTDAVKRFQAQNGLLQTGSVGPLTKAKLGEWYGKTS